MLKQMTRLLFLSLAITALVACESGDGGTAGTGGSGSGNGADGVTGSDASGSNTDAGGAAKRSVPVQLLSAHHDAAALAPLRKLPLDALDERTVLQLSSGRVATTVLRHNGRWATRVESLRLLRASDSEARSDAASASCSASRVVDCSPARRSASRRSIRRFSSSCARCSASFWAISIWPTSTVSERSARTDSSSIAELRGVFAELRGGVRWRLRRRSRPSRVRRVSRPHRRPQAVTSRNACV